MTLNVLWKSATSTHFFVGRRDNDDGVFITLLFNDIAKYKIVLKFVKSLELLYAYPLTYDRKQQIKSEYRQQANELFEKQQAFEDETIAEIRGLQKKGYDFGDMLRMDEYLEDRDFQKFMYPDFNLRMPFRTVPEDILIPSEWCEDYLCFRPGYIRLFIKHDSEYWSEIQNRINGCSSTTLL